VNIISLTKKPCEINCLEVVRAVKVHNLPIRQAALEFNMNYRALYRYCKNP